MPLEWVLLIVIVLLVGLPAIVEFVNWALIPFYSTQLMANLFKNDIIVRDDGEKVNLIKGQKKDRENSLYQMKKGFLGFGQVKYIAIDPTKWDKGNGSRYGGSTWRYQYPGKLWLKNLPRMLTSELHYEIASIQINEEDTKDNQKAIIKHNKYLHLIAKNNKEQTLKLLRCETDKEIEKYVREYLVIPPDLAKNDKDNMRYEQMVKDTVQEVNWIHEYCSTLPREVNLPEFTAAYPDQETCYEIMAKINAECEIESKAGNQFNVLTMVAIIGGIVLICGVVEIITIVLLA